MIKLCNGLYMDEGKSKEFYLKLGARRVKKPH